MPNFSGMTIPLRGSGSQGGALPQLKDPGVYVSGQAQSERVADVGNIAFAGEKEQAQALKGLGQTGIRATERLDDAYISYSKTKALEAQNEYDKQMQDFLYGKDGVFQKYRGESARQIPQLVQDKSIQVRGDLVQGMGQDSLATRWFDVSYGKSDAAYMVKADQQFRKEDEQWQIQTFDGRVANLAAQAEQDYADIDKVAEHMKTANSTIRERLAISGTTGEAADAYVRQKTSEFLANVAQRAVTNNDMEAFDRIAKYGQDNGFFDAKTAEKLQTMRGQMRINNALSKYSSGDKEGAAAIMRDYGGTRIFKNGRSPLVAMTADSETSNNPAYVKDNGKGTYEIGSFSFFEPKDVYSRFIKHIKDYGEDGKRLYEQFSIDSACSLSDSKNWTPGSGPAWKAYQKMAKDPAFAKIEEQIMEEKVFTPWLNSKFKNNPALRSFIEENPGVKAFVFSTMIQHEHPVDHVSNAFNKSGPDVGAFIDALADFRTKAKNSTPDRYKREAAIAKSMSGSASQSRGIFTADPKIMLTYNQSIQTIDRRKRYDVTTDVNARLPDARVLAMGGDVTELQACADELRSIGLTSRAEALHLEAIKYRETDKVRTWAGGATIPQQNERLGEIQTALQSPEVKQNPVLMKQYLADEEALKQVIAKKQAAFKADPALAADSTPYVRTLPSDATPVQRIGARIQAQAANGVAPKDIKPLTDSECIDLARRVKATQDPQMFFAGIKQTYGSAWKAVMQQMVDKKLVPSYYEYMPYATKESAEVLAKLGQEGAMAKLEKMIPNVDKEKKDIKERAKDRLQPWFSIMNAGLDMKGIASLDDVVYQLSMYNRSKGLSVKESVDSAIATTIGMMYTPCGTFMIPKVIGDKRVNYDPDKMELNANDIKKLLSAEDIDIRDINFRPGMSEQAKQNLVLSTIHRSGVWRNNANGTGVCLYIDRKPVKGRDGKIISRTWDEILDHDSRDADDVEDMPAE